MYYNNFNIQINKTAFQIVNYSFIIVVLFADFNFHSDLNNTYEIIL